MAAASDEDARQQRSLVLNDGFTIAFIVFCAAPTTTSTTDLHLNLSQTMFNLMAAYEASQGFTCIFLVMYFSLLLFTIIQKFYLNKNYLFLKIYHYPSFEGCTLHCCNVSPISFHMNMMLVLLLVQNYLV
jgi:hypothetical protein